MKTKALFGALALIASATPLYAGTACTDCVLLRGQLWEDISATTGPFNVDCEYRIRVSGMLSWGEVAFFPSYIGSTFLSVDYSKANQLTVSSSNKAQTVGDHGTHVARTFESCPTAIPVHHQ